MKQLIITVALMVFFAGCNNGQTNKNQEKKMKKLNSLEWAEAVYAIYDDCITELDGLVGEKPEPDAALKEKVETLKASVISRLLGQRRSMNIANTSKRTLPWRGASNPLSFMSREWKTRFRS
jgi:hypothetical protein